MADRDADDRAEVRQSLELWQYFFELTDDQLRTVGFSAVAVGKLRALRERFDAAKAANELRAAPMTEGELLFATFKGSKLCDALRMRGEEGLIDCLLGQVKDERAS